jgi:hypothetical protein
LREPDEHNRSDQQDEAATSHHDIFSSPRRRSPFRCSCTASSSQNRPRRVVTA